MNRPLLLRLNRLCNTIDAPKRAVFLRAALEEKFGIKTNFKGSVPDGLSQKIRAAIARYPAAMEGTDGALTPEIFAFLHEICVPQRKRRGVFYTPWHVGNLLAQETLAAALARRSALSNTQARALVFDEKFTPEHNALLPFLTQIAVCDPCAGAGGLLLPFALQLLKLRQKLEPHTPVGTILADIFARNLYAADLDKEALEILQLRAYLLLRRFAPQTDCRTPVAHVFAGDALQTKRGAVRLRQWGEFDVVLANPPFVGQKNHADIFRILKQDNFWKDKIAPKSDLLYLFFYLALDILKTDGCAGFISTPYFTTSAGAEHLRRTLQEQAAFLRLIDFGAAHLFAQAGQHTLLSVWCKSAGTPPCLVGQNAQPIPQAQLFCADGNYILTTAPQNGTESLLLKNMSACTQRLGDVAQISNGLMSGCDKISAAHLKKFPQLRAQKGEGVFVLSEKEVQKLRLKNSEKAKLKPFFKNSDISAFTANEKPHHYLVDIFYPNDRALDWKLYPNLRAHLARFKPVLLARRQNNNGIDKALARGHYWFGSVRRKMDFDGEKILVPHRSRTNTFAYCATPWYASSDVYFIAKPKQGLSLWYLLALFNSAPYKIWLTHYGKRKGNLLELYTAPLRALPVPAASAAEQEKLEHLAQALYQRKKQNLPTKDLTREIDRRVCALFGVTGLKTA